MSCFSLRISNVRLALEQEPINNVKKNILKGLVMAGDRWTFARRSMQNPEQHWNSSEVSLPRTVSLAALGGS